MMKGTFRDSRLCWERVSREKNFLLLEDGSYLLLEAVHTYIPGEGEPSPDRFYKHPDWDMG